MVLGIYDYRAVFSRHALCGLLLLSASGVPLQAAHALDGNALPANGDVVGGAADFDYQGNQLDITQHSNRVVIDWESFNIGSSAGVEFFQSGRNAIAVNRVTGADHNPTQILGRLKANGTVMVLDRNGVVFGEGSRVDVGGLVVSTGDIDTNAFMNGADILQLRDIDDGGVIAIDGQITIAEAGLAAFVAPTVVNNGVINAKMGRVALASGEAATLDLYGDGLIEIAADDALTGALVENSGVIDAQGGYVQLSVPMVESAVDNLINMDGVIEVSSVTDNGGKIVLEGGNVRVSGALKADGKTGGGVIHVGGEYQGRGDTLRAQTSIISAESLLSASSTDHGDGGEVIIWADKATRYEGKIAAKGGPNGGNGGFVEVSGKNYLEFAGDVDLSGDVLGELLLDPDDIDIVAGVSNPGEFVDDFVTFAENGGGTSVIGADTLSGRLSANANVTLQANNTIDVNADVTSTGSGNLTLETDVGGTITVNNAIDVNTGNLTLKADEIDINAALSGSGDIQLTAADVAQEIEVGSTDAADLNLTAAELGFLQDGWNQITISDTSHTSTVAVNEAVTFSDYTRFVNNSGSVTAPIDINATITTIDNADLYLQGKANPPGVHSFNGVHVGADLNIARDLIIWASPGAGISSGTINVGRDFIVNVGNSFSIAGDVNVGRDFSFSQTAQAFTLASNASLTAVGDITIDAGAHFGGTAIRLQSGSVLQAGGDITFESEQVTFDSTASISGNADGSSNLTFLEGDQDEAMEIGGQGTHDWSLTSAEIGTIQEGFNSITFGSNTYTEAIDITGAVSFSDDVSFFNTGNDATITLQDTFTTTDSANATFESGSAANVGWDAIHFDADLNIAGDLVTRTGTGGGAGHVQIDNTNITVGGDWTLLSDFSGQINTTNLNVGGDIFAERGSEIASYNFNASNANIGGDFTIDAFRFVRLNGGTYNVTGAVDFSNQSDIDTMDINANIVSGSTIDMSAAGNVDITGGLTSNGAITIGSDNNFDQDGAISISGSTINTNGGDFVAGGGANPLTTAAHAGQDGVVDVGVYIDNTDITTSGGDITIRGEGEDTANNNHGVILRANSSLNSGDGDISIYGTGGNGTGDNVGVFIRASSLTANDGDIMLSGFGGDGTGIDNYGIYLSNGATVTSTGTGAGAGTITLNGTGGDGTSDNYGVFITDSTTQITSVDGAIDITGTGNGSGGNSRGIYASLGANIASIGTGANAATITLNGTGGQGGTGNDGVYLLHDNTLITSVDGDIQVNGNAINTTGSNTGVHIDDGADITSTGTGANAARITLDGDAVNGNGIWVNGGSVASGYGDILLDGDVSNSGKSVFISRHSTPAGFSKIVSSGVGADAANITIDGTGNGGNGVFFHVQGGVETVDGDVTVTGTGRTSGIYMRFSAFIDAAGDGNVTLSGTNTGTTSTELLSGIDFRNSSRITVNDGNLSMTGIGGNSVDATGNGHGISMTEGGVARITSNGFGDITLNGTAGDCVNGGCYGVYMGDGSAPQIITNSTGDISITGRGGNVGSNNYGVYVSNGSDILSTASGADAGTITLNGTGGNGDDNNHGVVVNNNGTQISSVDGAIDITGRGGSNGTADSDNNFGIYVFNGADIVSTGAGANAATIRLHGVGGAGEDGNHGVRFSNNAGNLIDSADGDIFVTAQGQGFGVNNDDIRFQLGTIRTTNDADIRLNVNSVDMGGGFIDSVNDLNIAPRTAGTTIGLGGGAGVLNITDAELAQLSAGGKVTIGSVNAGLVTIDSVDVTAGAYATDIIGRSITVDNGLDVANSVYLQATQGDVRLNSGTVNADGGGNSLVINAAKDFINNAGVPALDAGIGGRFLVYASDFETTQFGGLTGNVIKGETFATLPPTSVSAGDGFIFSKNPVVDAANAQIARIQNVASGGNGYNLNVVAIDKVDNAGAVKAVVVEADGEEVTLIDGVSCSVSGASSSHCILN